MQYTPYIIVRLRFDQYASLYKLLTVQAGLGRFNGFDLQSIVLLDYLYKEADRQFNAFLNRDKRKLYVVKFSLPVALSLHRWLGVVPLDVWQQDARDQFTQVLVNYGLVIRNTSY